MHSYRPVYELRINLCIPLSTKTNTKNVDDCRSPKKDSGLAVASFLHLPFRKDQTALSDS